MARATSLYCGLALALSVSAPAEASTLFVGLNPPDGVAALVKQFHVPAGTTIVGASFGNNDARTVYPEVVLLHGASTTLGEGTVVATAQAVGESSRGVVAASWEPVTASEDGEYFVVIRFPANDFKRGVGSGAAVAATAGSVDGNFVAGSDGTLQKVSVDLSVALLTGTPAAGKAGGSDAPRAVSPERYETFLAPVGPNPAVAVVNVHYGVAQASFVELTIYDIAGREVRSLVRGPVAAGRQLVSWDGRDDRGQTVAAGVYLARMRAGDRIFTQKMVITR